jgi:hypothetical protein
MKNVDALLQENASKRAKLIRAEIIGVVLYTGPMVVCCIMIYLPHACPSFALSN